MPVGVVGARLLARTPGTGGRQRRPTRGPLALAVALIPWTVPAVRRVRSACGWATPGPREPTLHGSRWRRRHQAGARRCHHQRRLERLRRRNEQVRL